MDAKDLRIEVSTSRKPFKERQINVYIIDNLVPRVLFYIVFLRVNVTEWHTIEELYSYQFPTR